MRLAESADLIGGEVTGLDLSHPLSRSEFERFARFFYQRSVAVVRDQRLSPIDLLRFARCFGEPDQHFLTHYAHPDHPNILLISNVIENGKRIGFADAGRVWHSDGSYLQVPVAVTMLYAIEVPSEGGLALGDTQFASAWAAYDALPATMKTKLAGLQAVHQVGGRRRAIGTGEPSDRDQEDRQPDAIHAVVRVHPQTGRQYLYVSKGECSRIIGMDDNGALALIDELASVVQQPKYRHVHHWRVGDLLIWDNQAVQHLASFDYEWPKHRRLMHRITIAEHGAEIDP